ncbi:MAG: fimbrillin family protein [Bacteroidales bacterium]|nr:fimbrillin family protein [Bacteroidales bacterium]
MRRLYALILCLVAISSCMEPGLETGGDAFVLSSRDIDMHTKAAQAFDEGTSYYVYAFNRSEPGGVTEFNYPAVIDAVGTEDSNGHIGFTAGTRDHFGGRKMDFYGLTYGDSDADHWASGLSTANGEHPKYRLERRDGSLDDLRMAALENQSSSNSTGQLQLDFKHALAKLRFVAARQNASNLEGIYIKSISVTDYDAATLDLVDGAWDVEGSASERVIYEYNPLNPAIPDDAKKLTPTSALAAECLVFPSTSKDMTLHITTYNPTVKADNISNNSQTLEKDFTIPVDLECNHEYTLSVTITNEGVRIIILTPQEASWIVERHDEDIDLGQPVTFAGITWADRNIGATFAPRNNKIENIGDIRNWDNMRGYFFQFGRNVPYFVLKNRKITAPKTLSTDFENNDFTYCESGRNSTNAPYVLLNGESINEAYKAAVPIKTSWNPISEGGTMPLTYYDNKHRLTPSPDVIDISLYDGTQESAKNYAIVSGAASDSQPWWTDLTPKGTPRTWDDVRNQPTPKGWRIPTREDWAYIMPLSKRTGDITFNPGFGNANGKYTAETETGQIVIEKYDYGTKDNAEFVYHYYNQKDTLNKVWWAETGGDRRNIKIDGKLNKALEESYGDPVPGYTSQYLCISDKSNPSKGVLYAIKCQGTDDAYRLKWEFIIHDTWPIVGVRTINKVDQNIYPVTLRISRFTASKKDRLADIKDFDEEDWKEEKAVEVLELPSGGYVFTEAAPRLVNAGNETIYASSSIDPSDGWFYVVRLKYNDFNNHDSSKASRYLMLTKMRRAYGMSIRPVKDNTVIID